MDIDLLLTEHDENGNAKRAVINQNKYILKYFTCSDFEFDLFEGEEIIRVNSTIQKFYSDIVETEELIERCLKIGKKFIDADIFLKTNASYHGMKYNFMLSEDYINKKEIYQKELKDFCLDFMLPSSDPIDTVHTGKISTGGIAELLVLFGYKVKDFLVDILNIYRIGAYLYSFRKMNEDKTLTKQTRDDIISKISSAHREYSFKPSMLYNIGQGYNEKFLEPTYYLFDILQAEFIEYAIKCIQNKRYIKLTHTKICAYCGKQFEAYSSKKKYCSPKCKDDYNNRLKRNKTIMEERTKNE